MKKSEIYKTAQCVVIDNQLLRTTDKLEILRELMDAENLAKYSETQEEKKKGEEL